MLNMNGLEIGGIGRTAIEESDLSHLCSSTSNIQALSPLPLVFLLSRSLVQDPRILPSPIHEFPVPGFLVS